MNNLKKSICIIPAYNEEDTISSVINHCHPHVDTVLVINDASTDNTLSIAEKTRAKILTNKINLGYEISIKKGFNYAIQNEYNYLIFMDADGQHPIELLPKFLSHLKSGHSLVLGNRDFLPRYSEKFASRLFSLFLNIDDPFCGMKAFDVTLAESKFLLKDSYSFGLSILSKYLLLNPKKIQINICISERVSGKSRIRLNSLYLEFLLLKSSISVLAGILFAKLLLRIKA